MLELDRLFTISDLHIGGGPLNRAFRESEALTWLIGRVQTDESKRVGLLLNGDVFDFLADLGTSTEFDRNAAATVTRLAEDGELAPIFEALGALLRTAERWLIVQLGNHDIELALPSVRAALHDILGRGGPFPPERLIVETAGNGWTCRVSGRQVHAVHGNAYDPWNVVDHEGLRRCADDPMAPDPKTNAGTRLVIRVMNDVKETFPFVDLLKPEGAPLMAILAAVKPATTVREMLASLWAMAHMNVQRGTLSEAFGDDHVGVAGAIAQFLEQVPLPDEVLAMPVRTPEAAGVADRDKHFGVVRTLISTRILQLEAWINEYAGQPPETSLRIGLQRWLDGDRTFVVSHPTAIDKRIIADAPRRTDVLLAGHTHLPRSVSSGPMRYLNTGTWMRVLRLDGTRYLRDEPAFAELLGALRSTALDALDRLDLDPRARPVAIVDAAGAGLQSVTGTSGAFDLEDLA